MSVKFKNTISTAIFVLIVIVFCGLACVLHQKTIIEWWRPVVACSALAISVTVAVVTISARMAKAKMRAYGACVCFSLAFSLLIGGSYAANYYCSDPHSQSECDVVVTSKYTKQHYHTRRLSRNRTVRGESYLVYNFNLRLPDGRDKDVEVPSSMYAKTRTGQSLPLIVQNGFFGVKVIKNLSFITREHKRKLPKHQIKTKINEN